MAKAYLAESDFSHAIFVSADLSGAFLFDGVFASANFYGSNFTNADLSRANVSQAQFGQANFHEADLTDAEMSNAQLQGANLLCVNHLSLRQLTSVKSLAGAKLSFDLLDLIEEKHPHLLQP